MDSYIEYINTLLRHLKREVSQFEVTEQENNRRNQIISSAYENAYDRILGSAEITLRKIKQTCQEKKEFWNKMIKNNADLIDLDLKKYFYQEKRDAEDRYLDAVDQQKIKKVPYSILLGKNAKDKSLRDWQKNNKHLQEKVAQGTKTLNDWKGLVRGTNGNKYQGQPQFIGQFTQGDRSHWGSNRQSPIRQENNGSDFLKNFQHRRA